MSPVSPRVALHALLTLLLLPASVDARPGDRTSRLPAAERAELHALVEAQRYALRACPSGTRAPNPGQRWSTRFDGRGFTIEPARGGWSFGLELEAWGFSGASLVPETSAPRAPRGSHLVLDRGAGLEEWFVNGPGGLEHGFTLARRPEQPAGPLTLTLALRGELEPRVAPGGRSVALTDCAGAPVLDYAGLAAFDADGRELPARFELSGRRLLLHVEEEGARYPLTIDPLAQQAYLKASNTDAEDHFGLGIGVSGDTVVVGAPGEDSGSGLVNGDQSDDSASLAGAAYVFRRSGTTWMQEAYLKSPGIDAGDQFGADVAIDGNTIVVGASYEDSSASGVNGNPFDDSLPDSGAAFVFVRDGGTWSHQAYLKASSPDVGDSFGSAVTIEGDTIVVGAFNEDSSATGVNGDQTNDGSLGSGAAYVFTRSGTTWSQQAYLKASNTGAGDAFGQSLGLWGDTLVVSAVWESSAATGVNGNQASNGAPKAGAAYVFTRSGATWSQQAYLKASNTDAEDRFGNAVALYGDTLVVGAYGEDSAASGVDGDQGDDSLERAGAAYVFERTGSTWSQAAYLKPFDTDAADWFGDSVGVWGTTVVVSAEGEDGLSAGIGGDWTDDSGDVVGAAYTFGRGPFGWVAKHYVKASNPDSWDALGRQLDFDDGTLVIGAWSERSDATGVNGDQADDSLSKAGAAYVYDFSAPASPGVPFCSGDGSGTSCVCGAGDPGAGCPTSTTGGGRLAGTGLASFAADSFALEVSDLPGAKPGLCVVGTVQLNGGLGNLVGDGLLCVSPQLRSQVVVADAGGSLTLADWRGVPIGAFPGAAYFGAPTYYQWWFRDPANACTGIGFNFTNAWSVTWTP